MVMVMILRWWYGDGWRMQILRLKERVASNSDYFSIELLIRTFFSPFRQISAGKVRGPVGVQLRAFFDRLISRFIGSMVRGFMIVIGCVAIGFSAVLGGLWLALWLCMPALPLVGIVVSVIGWLPWIK